MNGCRPRRRGTDRVGDGVAWLLGSLALLTMILAMVVGRQFYGAAMEQARVESDRVQVEAVLLYDTAPQYTDTGVPQVSWVAARYADMHGQEHVTDVAVYAQLRAGDTVRVWLDPSGQVVSEPMSQGRAVVSAALAAAAVAALGWLALAAMWMGVRRYLDELNADAWAREWEQVEPVWSGRDRST